MMRMIVLLACRLVSMVVVFIANITCHTARLITWKMLVFASVNIDEYFFYCVTFCMYGHMLFHRINSAVETTTTQLSHV